MVTNLFFFSLCLHVSQLHKFTDAHLVFDIMLHLPRDLEINMPEILLVFGSPSGHAGPCMCRQLSPRKPQ